MGRMGRMGRMIMGLWDKGTFLWGTRGLWDGTTCPAEPYHALRLRRKLKLELHTLAKARRGAG
jgi:hypothetical protein